MNDTKLKRYALIGVIAVSAIIIADFAKYVISALLPFALAWGIAFALRPLSHKIASKIKGNERWIRLVLSLLFLLVLVVAVCALLWYVVNKSWHFLSNINENDAIMGAIDTVMNGGFLRGILFGGEFGEYIRQCVSGVVKVLLEHLAGGISGFAKAVPGAFIFVLVWAIATAYFAYDLENINASVKRLLPKRWVSFLVNTKNRFFDIGLKYIRSYLIIMLITILTLLLGLTLLRVEYAGLLALLIGILDILPVLGVGTALVPWSIISFIMGDIRLGVGLVALFLVNAILRQFIEPKIVGKHLGIHPVLTLVLLYVGYSFFGIWGMILLPPLGAFFKLNNLNKNDSSEVGESSGSQ